MKKQIVLWVACTVLALAAPREVSGQWVHLNPLFAGEVHALATQNGLLYAATNNQLCTSSDSGRTWFGHCFADNASTLLAVDSEIFIGSCGSVLRLNAHTDSESDFSSGLPDTACVTSLMVMGNRLLATTSYGVYSSDKNQPHWVLVWSRAFMDDYASAVCQVQSLLFIATEGGLFRSLDSGAHWTDCNVVINQTRLYGFTSLTSNHQNDIFAAGDGIVLGSSDSGKTWKSLSDSLTTLHIVRVFSSKFGLVCADDSGKVFFSDNEGKDWQERDKAFIPGVNTFLDFDTCLLAGGFGFVKSSTAATNWTSASYWIQSLQCKSQTTVGGVELFAILGSRIYAASDGMWVSSDDGENWRTMNEGLDNVDVGSIAYDDSNIIIDVAGGHLYLLKHDDSFWTRIDHGQLPQQFLQLALRGSNIFVSCGAGIFMSTNLGETWTKRRSGGGEPIAIIGNNLLFGFNGVVVVRHPDMDSSWNNPPITHFGDVGYFIVDGSVVYVQHAGVWKSLDSGITWNPCGKRPEHEGLFEETQGFIFEGENNKIFLLGSDSTWVDVSDGLDSGETIGYVVKDGYLYAGKAPWYDGYRWHSTTAGVWRRPLSEMIPSSSVEKPKQVTSSTVNFPNPFTRSTTIHFTLPSAEYVTLKVYDAEGREVSRLASGEMDAGEHDVTFDRSTLPAEVYFYRITAGGASQTGAMVIAD